MSTITGIFKADANGNVVVPLGPDRAGTEVEVSVQTRDEPMSLERMTDEQWRKRVAETAGSITDPTFRRHDQGHFEHRMEFD